MSAAKPPTSSGIVTTPSPTALKDQSGATEDRYKSSAREQVSNAYLGTSSVDMLRAATGGREDIPKKIKLAIRRQYFTYDQVFIVTASAMVFGMGVQIVVLLSTGAMEFTFAQGTINKLAFLFLGITLGALMGRNLTVGGLKCDPSSKQVKRSGKSGQACLDNFDCTNEKEPGPRICTHPTKHGATGTIRNSVLYGAPLGMFICFAWSAFVDEGFATSEERYIMTIIGMMVGVFLMFVIA